MQVQALFRESYGNEEEIAYGRTKDGVSITELPSDRPARPFYLAIVSIVKEAFLPQGFPDSVHPDYIPYQIWDTVQAFASTIMGTLTTHSIMQGVGVGESTATPLAAAITWILKDGTGMVGRIVFAWWNGTDLDRQCKKWRLFADILNDIAMGIELLVPYFSGYSVAILCTSTAMKSIVGVAGGATRAALTQHQALRNNLADVSAKDGSQETCVNLIASFVGIVILSLFHDGRWLMELYVLLVAIHLYANYSAVKALRLNSLNEDRLAIIIRSYLMTGSIPNTEEVNKKESILLCGKPTKEVCGFNIKMGVSLASIINKNVIPLKDTESLFKLFRDRKYLIAMDIKRRTIFISFKTDAQSSDVLKAYFHACFCGVFICMSLGLPLEYLLKSETNNPSYPLMRIYLLCNKHSTSDNGTFSSIATESICATNSIITNEYKAFVDGLENSEWNIRSNMLPVDAWRSSWKTNE